MRRSLTEIAAELEALMPLDFDPMNVDANGDHQLQAICTKLVERGNRPRLGDGDR
jgi:hypothetical protein